MKNNNNMRNFGELIGKIMVAEMIITLVVAYFWVAYTENNEISISWTVGVFAAMAFILVQLIMSIHFVAERKKVILEKIAFANKAYAKYDFLHEYTKADQMKERIFALENDLEALMSFRKGIRKYILI